MTCARWLAPLVFLGALALYVRTLAPSVAFLFDDSLEFQLVGYKLAIAHPTGYPLYTLLLKLFTFIPLGDAAYRANLLSAVCAALAVALVYLIVLQLTRSVFAALASAAMLAASPVFWSQAVIAEVYALNALFVAAIIGVASGEWRVKDDGRQPDNSSLVTRLSSLAFLVGLALTHHRTIILLAPALVIFVDFDPSTSHRTSLRSLVEQSKITPEREARSGTVPVAVSANGEDQRSKIIRPILTLLVPLLLYLYIPLRGSVGSLDGTYQNTPDSFARWVLASNYNLFLTQNPFNENHATLFFANLFVDQFGWLGVVLALVGLAALFKVTSDEWRVTSPIWSLATRHSWRAWFFAVAFLTYLAFVLVYRVPDVEVFAIPAFLIEAILIGFGVSALMQTSGRARVLVCVLLLLALALNFYASFPSAFAANDLSHKTDVRDYGRDIMAQDFPSNATLVGILGEMTLVRYFQETEHLHPELVTLAADRDDARMATIQQELSRGRAVFITRLLNGLPEQYSLGAWGPLVRVFSAPQSADLAPDAPRVGTIKYRVDALAQAQPQLVRVQLAWQPTAPITGDLKVSMRLLDGDTLLAQHDDWPVHNAYHTQFWRAGEAIQDVYDVRVPSALSSTSVRVLLIVYRANSGAEVGRIHVGDVSLGEARP